MTRAAGIEFRDASAKTAMRPAEVRLPRSFRRDSAEQQAVARAGDPRILERRRMPGGSALAHDERTSPAAEPR